MIKNMRFFLDNLINMKNIYKIVHFYEMAYRTGNQMQEWLWQCINHTIYNFYIHVIFAKYAQ